MDLPFLDISYKCNSTICGFLLLAFHSVCFSRFNHIVAYICISCLFIVKYYPTEPRCHILFIHPPVDRYLSCAYLLAIMNSAAMNICMQVFVDHLFSICGAMYLEVKLLSHMVIVHLLENHQTISTVDPPFYIPTSTCMRLPISLHSCQHLLFPDCVFFCLFVLFYDYSHPRGCEVVSHCGFYLYLSSNR
uniref:Uncharacterized protein n=1 Tax=Rousettus aegyptiacus TaxID=9407 RepID=A0A7J8KBB9_ROUAE|nr:hypothetical protein HJG63_007973 [Rousettus aegyptiacus]